MAAGVLYSCSGTTVEDVREYTETGPSPIRITLNVTYEFTEAGKLKNELYASRAEQYQEPDSSYSLLSGGFILTFYDENVEFDGRLSAENGFIRGDNSMMIARDSVVFVNRDNETLYTEELIWVQDSAKVFTNKFVTIEREDDIIYGKGLISDENFTNYIIKSPTGTFFLTEEDE